MSVINRFKATVPNNDARFDLALMYTIAACTLLAKRGDDRLTFTTNEIEDALATVAKVTDTVNPHIVVEEHSFWS